MSETKFTKGSLWCVTESDNGSVSVIGGYKDICDISRFTEDADCYLWPIEKEESNANANLIAAAPEMYEMLEDLASDQDFDLAKDIRDLLAKARGEQ